MPKKRTEVLFENVKRVRRPPDPGVEESPLDRMTRNLQRRKAFDGASLADFEVSIVYAMHDLADRLAALEGKR